MPHVPIAVGIVFGGAGLEEPLVLVGGVVHHHVHEDADVALFGFGDEAVEVGHGAVLGVDGFVVRDVVAEIDLRRGVAGGEPDGVDAEGFEVVEVGGDAVQVADAVAVGVLITARVDLVDDGVFPPVGDAGGCGGLSLSRGVLSVNGQHTRPRDTGAVCLPQCVWSNACGLLVGLPRRTEIGYRAP
jgi:hypothetical protein